MYSSDYGLDELLRRRPGEEVSVEWLADRMQTYIDLHPHAESAINAFASWLARADDED